MYQFDHCVGYSCVDLLGDQCKICGIQIACIFAHLVHQKMTLCKCFFHFYCLITQKHKGHKNQKNFRTRDRQSGCTLRRGAALQLDPDGQGSFPRLCRLR